jgi:hypothetical protein
MEAGALACLLVSSRHPEPSSRCRGRCAPHSHGGYTPLSASPHPTATMQVLSRTRSVSVQAKKGGKAAPKVRAVARSGSPGCMTAREAGAAGLWGAVHGTRPRSRRCTGQCPVPPAPEAPAAADQRARRRLGAAPGQWASTRDLEMQILGAPAFPSPPAIPRPNDSAAWCKWEAQRARSHASEARLTPPFRSPPPPQASSGTRKGWLGGVESSNLSKWYGECTPTPHFHWSS